MLLSFTYDKWHQRYDFNKLGVNFNTLDIMEITNNFITHIDIKQNKRIGMNYDLFTLQYNLRELSYVEISACLFENDNTKNYIIFVESDHTYDWSLSNADELNYELDNHLKYQQRPEYIIISNKKDIAVYKVYIGSEISYENYNSVFFGTNTKYWINLEARYIIPVEKFDIVYMKNMLETMSQEIKESDRYFNILYNFITSLFRDVNERYSLVPPVIPKNY